MATNTPNLSLYKKDPSTDGTDTFDIKQMMNDNWDAIDEGHGDHETRITDVEAEIADATITQTLTEPINVLDSDRVTDLILKAFTGQTNINHVPLFDSGLWSLHANVTVDSPSKITLNATNDQETSTINVSVKSSATYYYNANYDTSRGNARITLYDNTDTASDIYYDVGSFTTNADTEYVEIAVRNKNGITGNVTFENIMLNEGSTAQAFTKNVRPIKNPVLFSKGKNLIKPFTHWDLHANATVISPYELELNATADNQANDIYIKAIPNQTYTFKGEGKYYITLRDKDKSWISDEGIDVSESTFTTTTNTNYIRIATRNDSTGTFTFTQPQLELGDTATEFTEYNESYLVLKSSFYEGDQPYQDPNGNWRKLAEKKEMALDGSLDLSFYGDYNGFKAIQLPLIDWSQSYVNTEVVKNNGVILQSGSVTSESDRFGAANNNLVISLSDSDTGWADSWTSSHIMGSADFNISRDADWSDRIKGYVNGWFLNIDPNGDNNVSDTHWESMYDSAVTTTDVDEVISRNLHEENGEEGYRLVFELAEKEDVAIESEGSLRLDEGLNHIEMAEAFVVREVVTPELADGNYYINSTLLGEESKLSKRSLKLVDIFRNGNSDIINWNVRSDSNTYGVEKAFIEEENYNGKDPITVSYLALRYQLSAPLDNVDVQFNKSMISVQQGLVDNVTDNERKISVLSETKANKHQEQYIEPILMNGWGVVPARAVGYYKDDFNTVDVKGTTIDGTVGETIFILPKGYRPSHDLDFACLSYDGTNAVTARVWVHSDGRVRISHGANNELSLSNISFRAEQ